MRRGQTFLALIFLIGGIVVLIGLTLALFALSFIDTGYGYQASVRAEAVANSGVEDALLQLDRNPSFTNGGYPVSVGSSTATVSVVASSTSPGISTILSTATVGNRTRKVDVIVAANASTSQVTVISWQTIQ